jgi:hypothetical protein
MKAVAIILLIVWGVCVHRRARLPFIAVFAASVWCLALYGCATERAPPPPAPQGICSGTLDGSYIFINCRRTYP